MSALELPRPLINQLLHYAQTNPKHEVCGLISSKNGTALRCYPVANAKSPQCRYAMDKSELAQTLRQIDDQGEELLAIFHSHPVTPPQPSASEIAEDQYPDIMKLIISLDTAGVLEMAAFFTRSGKIEPVELTLAH